MWRLATVAVAAAFLAGCSIGASQATAGPGQILDGFPIGQPVDLAAGDGDREALATQALDTREPDHPAIVSVATYAEDLTNTTIFPQQPVGRSGTVTVFVFTFSDGSQAATGVYCGVGGCQPVAIYAH
jgi:hypothetical protein